METFKITKAERTELLKYMWKRPYGEVAQFIAILAGLKPLKTGMKFFTLDSKKKKSVKRNC